MEEPGLSSISNLLWDLQSHWKAQAAQWGRECYSWRFRYLQPAVSTLILTTASLILRALLTTHALSLFLLGQEVEGGITEKGVVWLLLPLEPVPAFENMIPLLWLWRAQSNLPKPQIRQMSKLSTPVCLCVCSVPVIWHTGHFLPRVSPACVSVTFLLTDCPHLISWQNSKQKPSFYFLPYKCDSLVSYLD